MTSENLSEPAISPAVIMPPLSNSSNLPIPGAFIPTPTASLYVGELSPDISESMLFDLFNQVGPVSSIRICRDAITRRSLGYAYINYHNPSDCERAIDTLNYSPIKGRPCRIMWSQRDPSIRRSGIGNIFIKSLDSSIDNKTLHDTFSAFGHILSCKVVVDEKGNSKGYGFVHFETQEAADLAIEKVNGMLLNDIKVFVGKHIPRRERFQKIQAQKCSFTNIFVKNLDLDITREEFEVAFSKFGSIVSAAIQIDSSGNSKGFGFVSFSTHGSAQNAIDEMNGQELFGKIIYVGRAQKKSERDEDLRRQFESLKLERLSKYQGVNLYVKNLSETIDDERLKQEFSPYGNISSCKIMLDEKQVSKGFGFVCYSTSEEASRAAVEMNGRMLLGKPLYVSVAQRREERRAQLEAKYSAISAQLRFQQATGMGIFAQGPLFYSIPSNYNGHSASIRNFRLSNDMPPSTSSYGDMRPFRPVAGNFKPISFQGNRKLHTQNTNRYQQSIAKQITNPDQSSSMGFLASLSPEEQKRAIGDRIFAFISSLHPEFSAKITGMLLEMDNSDLVELLDRPDQLNIKVNEALEALNQHNILTLV